jgi:thiol-disulfide isomerase/thioredoxin
MKKSHWLACAAIGVVFGVMGAFVATRQAPAPAAPAAPVADASTPGGAVQALLATTLNDVAGKPQALSQWKGKALLVNFWAPWCAPCVQEMPELAELARDGAARKVQVIGIGIDSPANIAHFNDTLKISYPLYVGGMSGTELARQFGNSAGGLPYTVLIGADGRVRKTYLGRLKFDQLKADLSAL